MLESIAGWSVGGSSEYPQATKDLPGSLFTYLPSEFPHASKNTSYYKIHIRFVTAILDKLECFRVNLSSNSFASFLFTTLSNSKIKCGNAGKTHCGIIAPVDQGMISNNLV